MILLANQFLMNDFDYFLQLFDEPRYPAYGLEVEYFSALGLWTGLRLIEQPLSFLAH